MIQFECPHCGHHTSAPEQLAGQRTACTACRQTVRVPRVFPHVSSPVQESPHAPQHPSHPVDTHQHSHPHAHHHPHEHEHPHEHTHPHPHGHPHHHHGHHHDESVQHHDAAEWPDAAFAAQAALENVEEILTALREEREVRSRLEARLKQVERELRQAQAAGLDGDEGAASTRLQLASLAAESLPPAAVRPDYSNLEIWLAEARLRADDAEAALAPAGELQTLQMMARLQHPGTGAPLAPAARVIEAAETRAAYNAAQVRRLTEELAAARAEQMRTAARLREFEDRLERAEARARAEAAFATDAEPALDQEPMEGVPSFHGVPLHLDREWPAPEDEATGTGLHEDRPAETEAALEDALFPEAPETAPVLELEPLADFEKPAEIDQQPADTEVPQDEATALNILEDLESALAAWGSTSAAPVPESAAEESTAPAAQEDHPFGPIPDDDIVSHADTADAEPLDDIERALSNWWGGDDSPETTVDAGLLEQEVDRAIDAVGPDAVLEAPSSDQLPESLEGAPAREVSAEAVPQGRADSSERGEEAVESLEFTWWESDTTEDMAPAVDSLREYEASQTPSPVEADTQEETAPEEITLRRAAREVAAMDTPDEIGEEIRSDLAHAGDERYPPLEEVAAPKAQEDDSAAEIPGMPAISEEGAVASAGLPPLPEMEFPEEEAATAPPESLEELTSEDSAVEVLAHEAPEEPRHEALEDTGPDQEPAETTTYLEAESPTDTERADLEILEATGEVQETAPGISMDAPEMEASREESSAALADQEAAPESLAVASEAEETPRPAVEPPLDREEESLSLPPVESLLGPEDTASLLAEDQAVEAPEEADWAVDTPMAGPDIDHLVAEPIREPALEQSHESIWEEITPDILEEETQPGPPVTAQEPTPVFPPEASTEPDEVPVQEEPLEIDDRLAEDAQVSEVEQEALDTDDGLAEDEQVSGEPPESLETAASQLMPETRSGPSVIAEPYTPHRRQPVPRPPQQPSRRGAMFEALQSWGGLREDPAAAAPPPPSVDVPEVQTEAQPPLADKKKDKAGKSVMVDSLMRFMGP